jgi:hypothetical protein
MRHAICSVGLTTALLILLFVPAGVASADDIAWKAAHDADPHLPLTSQQFQMTADKRAAENQVVAGSTVPSAFDAGALTGTDVTSTSPQSTCGAACGGGGGYPSSASLTANQTPQATSYYCGPAAVHEALDAVGISLPQSAAATALHTTTDGTAWSGGGTSPSGYPVPDVLDRYQGRNYYVPQPVSSPTSTAINTYEKDLEEDISALRAPIVGDAWETPYSNYRLVGHPTDRTIFHWFEIRGYYGSGGTTLYEDSVHNATSVSWHTSVPAYSNLPSNQIVSIVAGRGYVW